MKTKGKKQKVKDQRLWVRVLQSGKVEARIDAPVHPDTTIKDLGDLEESLNNIFEGPKFKLDYRWEAK